MGSRGTQAEPERYSPGPSAGAHVTPPSTVYAAPSGAFAGSRKSPPTMIPWRGSVNASEKMPPAGEQRDRGLDDVPGSATVRRVEDARDDVAAGAEPRVATAGRFDAGAARGKAELTRQRVRHPARRDELPAAPAVLGRQDLELAAHGVAHDQAAVTVEERHTVVERCRVGVLEGLRPRLAAVLRDVDARGVAGADRKQYDVIGREGLDVAERLPGGVGWGHVLPGGAAVDRAQHGAAAAAHPGGALVDRSEAAEARRGAGRPQLPGERGTRPGCGSLARKCTHDRRAEDECGGDLHEQRSRTM